MIILAQELIPSQKQPGSDYQNLITYVLQKDLLNTQKYIYSSSLTLEKYIEMVYRWSFFFKGDQLS